MRADEPAVTAVTEQASVGRALRAATLGRVAAFAVTLLGAVYAVGLVAVALASRGAALRPSPAMQWWAALGTLAICPPIVVTFHALSVVSMPPARRTTQLSLAFALLFGLTIIVSRLVFLTTSARRVFGAALLTVEFVGWGLFLSMAILAAVWALRHDSGARGVRRAGLVYAAIALVGLSAHARGSAMSAVGFLAWGVVLYLWTWRLAWWFEGGRRRQPGRN